MGAILKACSVLHGAAWDKKGVGPFELIKVELRPAAVAQAGAPAAAPAPDPVVFEVDGKPFDLSGASGQRPTA